MESNLVVGDETLMGGSGVDGKHAGAVRGQLLRSRTGAR